MPIEKPEVKAKAKVETKVEAKVEEVAPKQATLSECLNQLNASRKAEAALRQAELEAIAEVKKKFNNA